MISLIPTTGDNQRDHPQPSPSLWSRSVLAVGILLGACSVALNHDFNVRQIMELETVEEGRGLEEQEDFENNVGAALLPRKLGFLGIVGLGCWCWWYRAEHARVHWNLLTLAVLLVLGWAAASTYWSADRSETLRELVRVAGYVVLGFGLACRYPVQQLATILTIAAAVFIGSAVGAEILAGSFQPWIASYRLSGSTHSNALAQHSILLCLGCVYLLSSRQNPRKRLPMLFLLAACVVLGLTKARAAMVALPLALIVYWATGRRWQSWVFCASVALTLLGFILLAGTLSGFLHGSWEHAANLGRDEASGNVGSLTGRIPLWELLWNDVREAAWVGYGLAGYWTTDRIAEIGEQLEWFPRHSHSVYMQALIDLGAIGAMLCLSVAVLAIAHAAIGWQETRQEAYRLVVSYFVVALLHGLVEAGYIVPRDLGLYVGPLVLSLIVVHEKVRPTLGVLTRAGRDTQRFDNWTTDRRLVFVRR